MSSSRSLRNFRKLVPECQPETVVIIGLGYGDEVWYIRKVWPRARVIGVEPVAENVARIKPLNMPDVLVQKAIGTPGKYPIMHLSLEPDERASLLRPIVELANTKTCPVNVIMLDDLRKQTAPWSRTLLWLDAEGAELDIVYSGVSALLVEWINVEVAWVAGRHNYPKPKTIESVLSWRGFQCVGAHSLRPDGRSAELAFVRSGVHELMCRQACEVGNRLKVRRHRHRMRKAASK